MKHNQYGTENSLYSQYQKLEYSFMALVNKLGENDKNSKTCTVEELVGNLICAATALALTGLTTMGRVICEVVKNIPGQIKSNYQQARKAVQSWVEKYNMEDHQYLTNCR